MTERSHTQQPKVGEALGPHAGPHTLPVSSPRRPEWTPSQDGQPDPPPPRQGPPSTWPQSSRSTGAQAHFLKPKTHAGKSGGLQPPNTAQRSATLRDSLHSGGTDMRERAHPHLQQHLLP